jgi:hypothetical protein
VRAAGGRQGTESRPCRTSTHQAASAHQGCSREVTAQLFRIWSKPCGMYASVGGSTALEGRSSRTSLSIALTTWRTKKTSTTNNANPTSTRTACPITPITWSMTPPLREEAAKRASPHDGRLPACRTSQSGRPSPLGSSYALAASGMASATTPRSPVTSNSATCHAGATLFLVTWTRTRLPMTWPPSRTCPSGRRSRRTEA